jgi:hypothetical protein
VRPRAVPSGPISPVRHTMVPRATTIPSQLNLSHTFLAPYAPKSWLNTPQSLDPLPIVRGWTWLPECVPLGLTHPLP